MDNGLKASCRSKGEVLMCYVDNFTRTSKESNEQPRTGGVVADTTTDTPQSKEAVSRTCSRKRMILMPFSNRQHKICNSRMSKRNRQRTSCTSQTPTRSTPVPPRGGTHRISDRYFVIFFCSSQPGLVDNRVPSTPTLRLHTFLPWTLPYFPPRRACQTDTHPPSLSLLLYPAPTRNRSLVSPSIHVSTSPLQFRAMLASVWRPIERPRAVDRSDCGTVAFRGLSL